MKNLGIVVEYNPFHNGHIFHIEQSKQITKSDNTIAVMSSNFVQRGEPSVLNKFSRTQSALENGVDLVLELPTPYSTASAELFSQAAVSILNKSGIINSIAFGSECGDVSQLKTMAQILVDEPEAFKSEIKKALDTGVNFPTARAIALNNINPLFSELISSPNNILGVEYLKALIRLKSDITPYTVTRSISNYHDEALPINHSIASATSIRNNLKDDINSINSYVPKSTLLELHNSHEQQLFPSFDNLFLLIKFKLSILSVTELEEILDCTEGLSSKLLSTISQAFNYTDFVDKLVSKRYPKSKIQRLLSHLLLNITLKDIELYKTVNYIPYIRVLGFRKEKSFLLKEITEKSSVPVVTNIKNANLCPIGNKMLQSEFMYTNIYNTLINDNHKKNFKKIPLSLTNFEQRQPLIIIK